MKKNGRPTARRVGIVNEGKRSRRYLNRLSDVNEFRTAGHESAYYEISRDHWTVPEAGQSRKSGARVSVPHKSRKISREGARQKMEGAAVENRRLTFLSVPPFCHQGDCTLLHRESLRGSSVICEGVSCAWTVINARIQNKSTHEPRILMNVHEWDEIPRGFATSRLLAGVIRGFWVICYGDCWD